MSSMTKLTYKVETDIYLILFQLSVFLIVTGPLEICMTGEPVRCLFWGQKRIQITYITCFKFLRQNSL